MENGKVKGMAGIVPIYCSHDKVAEVEGLIPNPRNPNRHPEAQIKALAKIIKFQGWRAPITISMRSGFVVRGHGRLMAAQELGLQVVPVDYQGYDSEAEEWADLVADNRVAELAEIDQELLKDIIQELDTGAIDIELTGYEVAEIENMLTAVYDGGDQKTEAGHTTLAERFLVPPFTVLDARQGYWQDRKRAWLDVGIRGELGRSDVLLGNKSREGYGGDYDCSKGESAWGGSGSSIFDPVLCEIAYRWFCPAGGHVLDPFAGESTKGIVATYLGYEYTGVELREEQVAANVAQAQAMQLQPEWIVGDSSNIGELLPPGQEYDLIFTSPPYYDLEIYSESEKDGSAFATYEKFMSWYNDIFKQAVQRLKENRFVVVKIGEVRDKKTGAYRNFLGGNIECFTSLGLHYYNEAVLVTALGSLPIRAGRAFAKSRKLGKTHQNIIIFYKGDLKAIKDYFPEDIEYADITAQENNEG